MFDRLSTDPHRVCSKVCHATTVTFLLFAVAPLPFASGGFSAQEIAEEAASSDVDLSNGFRVVFVTEESYTAYETDIAAYNLFVQSEAEASGSLVQSEGWTWKAIIGTPAIDAFSNTSTSFDPNDITSGLPVFNISSELVAPNYYSLWNSELVNPINDNQYGEYTRGDVWTGPGSYYTAGSPYNLVLTGRSESRLYAFSYQLDEHSRYRRNGSFRGYNYAYLYAMSPILYIVNGGANFSTVNPNGPGTVPEPSPFFFFFATIAVTMMRPLLFRVGKRSRHDWCRLPRRVQVSCRKWLSRLRPSVPCLR